MSNTNVVRAVHIQFTVEGSDLSFTKVIAGTGTTMGIITDWQEEQEAVTGVTYLSSTVIPTDGTIVEVPS